MAFLLVSAQALWGSAIKHDGVLNGSFGQVAGHLATDPKIWAGAALYVLTVGVYFWVLSKLDFFPVQVSMTAISVLLSTALAAVVFRESISRLNLVGAALVVVGLALVFSRP
jgi:uncharacterized membrane protein